MQSQGAQEGHRLTVFADVFRFQRVHENGSPNQLGETAVT